MIKSTLLAGAFLLTGICFGQNSNFQKHVVPEHLMQMDALKEDVNNIKNLEQLSEQSATSSRSRGTEVQSQLQAAYKTYLSHLDLMLDIVVTDADRKMIAEEQKFVTTLIH